MNDHLTGLQKALLWCVLIAPLPGIIFAVWCFLHGYTKSGIYVLFALTTVLLLPSALKRPQHPLSMLLSILGGFHACMLTAATLVFPCLYCLGTDYEGSAGIIILAPPVMGVWGAKIALRWFKDRQLTNGSEKDWNWKGILQELSIGMKLKTVVMLALAFAAAAGLMSVLSGRSFRGVLISAGSLLFALFVYFAIPACISVMSDAVSTMNDDPDLNAADCLDRALLYMNQGSHSGDREAMEWLKKIPKKESQRHKEGSSPADPYHMDLLQYYVTLQIDLGYLRKAAAACKEGLEHLEPASGERTDPAYRPLRRFFHETLFYCYGRLGKEKEKAASAVSFLNLLPQGDEVPLTDPETLCRFYTTASAVMRDNNDCRAALEYLDQAAALLNDQEEASRRSYMEGLILKEKAAVLKQEGDSAGAEESLMKALSLFGSITDEIPKNRSRVQAGLIYYTLAETRRTDGNFEEALRYYETALDIFEDRFGDDHFYAVDVYLGLADRYLAMGFEDDAAKYYRKAAELLKDYTGIDSPEAIRAYRALADIYKEKQQMHKEKECLDHALDGYRAAGRIDDPEFRKIKARINELMEHIGLGG